MTSMGTVKPAVGSMSKTSVSSGIGGSKQGSNGVACGGCGGIGLGLDLDIDLDLHLNLGGLLGGVLGLVGGLLGGGRCH
ncbi:hypothetical protein SAMD00019534_112220 [Acytostelium subglobosum LB1]|uniref:hypothetical protein n=1 Tax=Acytostelium subglobosum LB1 TaxID=1410327 RepID=UPI0006451346|nr:hypothetical protein SAMD00019534_112220 [Acytostelium subglobosum LB1]GAM28046.1 hypothetical protein SAMD00019534_112220 [Acytostelium subglobosum LB1]|eukprot:XP_012749005.1 hypothetical protein SAMD00019534_112220 [Acytostelium subglobosum LB1]